MTVQVLYAGHSAPGRPILLVHGGAGPRVGSMDDTDHGRYRAGLTTALDLGYAALVGGGSALDAVCAAVVSLEDNPMFNSAHGAALTSAGTAELDAAVMTGDGRVGAIAVSTRLRNPVLAARTVLERSIHVLMVDPDEEFARRAGLQTVVPAYFVTERRVRQLHEVQARRVSQERHGTVGAVALDDAGHVACATSTGGMVGQAVGRVGDTALIGAGSFACDDSAAVSCTGEGEAYIRACVAHDITARMRYRGEGLADAARSAYDDDLERVEATGGTIAVTPGGDALILHNSSGMLAGYRMGDHSGVFV